MAFLKSLVNTLIYHMTEKPTEYHHVDHPRSLQDYRQIQYNNWCKAKGVYNGSYMPKNPDTLLRKGWRPTQGKPDGTVKNYVRKSNGQRVRYDAENDIQHEHYHWINGNTLSEARKNKASNVPYRNRYGRPCNYKTGEHHLAPLDRDFVSKKRKDD